MEIDSNEAIQRMTKLIDIYSKYGYREEVMFRTAVGYCIDIIREMAGGNNDVGRMYNVPTKRVLRAKTQR